MEFIGQQHLFKTINNYTLATMPHTILLLGPEGCGKKTMVKYISNKLGLELVTVTEKIDQDKIIDFQQSALKKLYLIDLTKFKLEKEQNQFLKFIEEPVDNVYIILINNSEIGILPTVLNRCVTLHFAPYTIEQLKHVKLFSTDLIYNICVTPGQLNTMSEDKLLEMHKLCESLVTKLNVASYANAISVAARINYKEDYTKFDFTTFIAMLEYVALEKYKKENSQLALTIYLYTIKKRQALIQNSGITKEAFMISFMDGLWREAN